MLALYHTTLPAQLSSGNAHGDGKNSLGYPVDFMHFTPLPLLDKRPLRCDDRRVFSGALSPVFAGNAPPHQADDKKGSG